MTNKSLTRWADEKEVIWLYDPAQYSYVRQYRIPCDATDDPITGLTDHIVGYTTLKNDAPRDAPGRKFYRRAFVIKKQDRDYRGDDAIGGYYLDCCPSEAVDPLTVAPGVEGAITERALGRSNPTAN